MLELPKNNFDELIDDLLFHQSQFNRTNPLENWHELVHADYRIALAMKCSRLCAVYMKNLV